MQRGAEDCQRKLDLVFGDVLPDRTSDDRTRPGDTAPDEHDQWLQDNRPPHHDTA
ncbi:MAG: hypothetical protein WCC38_02690 [Pseudonocardiaceae bacterium]